MDANGRQFTPALGRAEWTGLYDVALALATRERRWREALIRRLAPTDEDTILDVGCGTGSLAIRIKQHAPACRVIGLDPDPEALLIAGAKAKRAGVEIEFLHGFASDAAAVVGAKSCAAVVSSLVFHQTPVREKWAGLAAMREVLFDGGRFWLADYGWQRTALMRLCFRLSVQQLDGREDTQPNADGILLDMLREIRLQDVGEMEVIPTMTGSISIYGGMR